jgi:DNA-binding MarR family transcriptional regulator
LSLVTDTAPCAADVEAIVYALPEIVRGAGPTRHSVGRQLGVPQVRALLQLARGDALTIGELASRLGVSCAAASQVADRLVELDLARRERPAWDRRVVQLRLTDSARERVEEALALRRGQAAEVLAALTPAEQQGFVRGLRLLAAVLVRDLPARDAPTAAGPAVRA